jgi:hypothetical protein
VCVLHVSCQWSACAFFALRQQTSHCCHGTLKKKKKTAVISCGEESSLRFATPFFFLCVCAPTSRYGGRKVA